jgi:long-chain fatty acid transport protein
MTQRIWRAVFVCLLGSTPALASGFYFGENGTRALSMGGAFAGQADDLSAIQHNPAGLAQQQGYSFLAAAGFARNDVTFLRKDPGADTTLASQITNAPGAFFLPALTLGYGTPLFDRRFTVAVGVYAPPSVGKYGYPAPNYDKVDGKYVSNPRKSAPERYALIENNVVLAYPTVSLAYELHPRFSVGVSLQYVYADFMFKQAMYSGLFMPKRQADEDPIFDTVVTVRLLGKPAFTGILGVLVTPVDKLSIGASISPPVKINASGTLDFVLGEAATGLGTTVSGSAADFTLTMPLEAKVGVHYQATDELGINADFVYQGWNSVDAFRLKPIGVSIKVGAADPTNVEQVDIVRNWKATMSGRLGASYQIKDLSLRAGGWYEQGASPTEYTNIDFAHFSRFFVTAGVGYKLGSFELLATGALTPTVTTEVTESAVHAASTDSMVPGGVVGVGTYTSGGWFASFGVRGNFGAGK